VERGPKHDTRDERGRDSPGGEKMRELVSHEMETRYARCRLGEIKGGSPPTDGCEVFG